MEQHAYNTDDRKKPGYLPLILIVAILGLLAWLLLHNYNSGSGNGGYIWKEHGLQATHNDAESNNGTESHGGPASVQRLRVEN